jgi:PAS domain S-box-containing protein
MKHQLKTNRKKLSILASVVFFILSLFGALHFYRLKKEKLQVELNSSFLKTNILLSDKLEAFIYGLQGMGGIVRSLNFRPSNTQIKDYAQFRQNFLNFNGALGFGFIRRIPHSQLGKYKKEIKAFSPNLNFRELTPHNNDHYIIEFIEPFDPNKSAVGLDIGSENKRRVAAETSMLQGKPILTAPIQLVQAEKSGAGFLFLLPIYKGNQPGETEAFRRRDLIGWAYSPILAKDVVKDVLNVSGKMGLQITDITDPANSEEVFSSPEILPNAMEFTSTLLVGGRKWLIKGMVEKGEYLSQLVYILGVIVIFLVLIFGFIFQRLINVLIEGDEASKRASEIESWREAVLSGTNYMMIASDPDGIITIFNQAAEKALEYSRDELIGKANPGIFHDLKEVELATEKIKSELDVDLAPGFETFVFKSRLSLTPDTNEWTYISKSGRRFPVKLCITTILNEQKVVTGYLGVAEDITYLKEMSATLEAQRASIVASAKLSSLGEMAGGIAHEINNPLSIILGRVMVIRDMLKASVIVTTDISDSINIIESTSLRIGKIVKGLRTFSRDGMKDPHVSISVGTLLEDVFSLCRERFKNNHVELIVDGNIDKELRCRPVEISQIMINLLLNSYDAVQASEKKWVKVLVNSNDKMMSISISDSGAGIASEIREKIMDPFFTTKDPGKGTGLGLSISKGIAEAHSGTLYFDHNQAHTTFILELPL